MKLGLRGSWVRTAGGQIAVIGNSTLAAGPFVNLTARARLETKMQI